MAERSWLRGARRRIESRRIVDQYLVALERGAREGATTDATDEVGAPAEIVALESSFIRVAADFGRWHGISPSTWLEAKVSAEVLAAAGVIGTVINAVEVI